MRASCRNPEYYQGYLRFFSNMDWVRELNSGMGSAIKSRIAVLTSKRLQTDHFLSMSFAENVALPAYPRLSSNGRLSAGAVKKFLKNEMADLLPVPYEQWGIPFEPFWRCRAGAGSYLPDADGGRGYFGNRWDSRSAQYDHKGGYLESHFPSTGVQEERAALSPRLHLAASATGPVGFFGRFRSTASVARVDILIKFQTRDCANSTISRFSFTKNL